MKNESFTAALWSLERINDETVLDDCPQGTVSFDGRKGVTLKIPIGKLYDNLERAGQSWVRIHEPSSLPIVYGFSQHGDYFVLKDVTAFPPGFSSPGLERQTLSAKSMLSSRTPIEANPRVKWVTFEMPGLREWLGNNPAKMQSKHFTSGGRVVLQCEFDTDDASPIVLFERDAVTVDVLRYGVWPGHKLSSPDFSLQYKCEMRISFEEGYPLLTEALKQWVGPLWDFISFCTGTRPSLTSVSFCDASSGTTGRYYAPYVGVQTEMASEDFERAPFRYDDLSGCIDSVVGEWLAMDGDVKRAATVLIGLLDEWKAPVNLTFIACAGAFEALGRAQHIPDEFFDLELKSRLDAIRESDLDNITKDWALNKLEGKAAKGADSRAKYLVSVLGEYAAYIVPDEKAFLGDHRILRNSYAHLSEILKEPLNETESLYVNTWATWLLSYGAIALKLGLSPKTITMALYRSRFMENHVFRARKMYAKPQAEDE